MKTKEREILIQQKVSKVLDNSFALIMIEDRKNEFNELVYTFIIRHLSDSVLQKFGKHNTVEKACWALFDSIHAQQTFLTRKLFQFQNLSLKRFRRQL